MAEPSTPLTNQETTAHLNYHMASQAHAEGTRESKKVPLQHHVHEHVLNHAESINHTEALPEGENALAGYLRNEITQLSDHLNNTIEEVNAAFNLPSQVRAELDFDVHERGPLKLIELKRLIKVRLESTQGSSDLDEVRDHTSWRIMQEIIKQWETDQAEKHEASKAKTISFGRGTLGDVRKHIEESHELVNETKGDILRELGYMATQPEEVRRQLRAREQASPQPTEENAGSPRNSNEDRPWMNAKLPPLTRRSHSKAGEAEVNGELARQFEQVVKAAEKNTFIHTSLRMNTKHKENGTIQRKNPGGFYTIGGFAAHNVRIEEDLPHLVKTINSPDPYEKSTKLYSDTLSGQELKNIAEVFSFIPATKLKNGAEDSVYFDYAYYPTRCENWEDLPLYPDPQTGRNGNMFIMRTLLPKLMADKLQATLAKDPEKVRDLVEKLAENNGGITPEDWWGGTDRQPIRPPYDEDRKRGRRPHMIIPVNPDHIEANEWNVVV